MDPHEPHEKMGMRAHDNMGGGMHKRVIDTVNKDPLGGRVCKRLDVTMI